jgi:hypothetical protein
MNDVEQMTWKQDQDFREQLRLYAFLAEDMIFHHRYSSDRMRSDLDQIIKICGMAEVQPYWSEFGGKSSEAAHAKLRELWVRRLVTPASIQALDDEYRAFMDEVESDRKDRLAGVIRPKLKDILAKIGA